MSRTFLFGCSYTEYMWPTWASILLESERKYGREAYNFGQCGISNNAIMNNMCIADKVFQFTDSDRIMVVWTSLHRRDRLESYWCDRDQTTYWQWRGDGNIFGGDINGKPNWLQHYIQEEWNLEIDLITNFSVMHAADRAFDFAFQGHMYEPILEDDIEDLGIDPDIVHWYNAHYSKNKHNLFSKSTTQLWSGAPGLVDQLMDPHPDPVAHLEYLQNCVLPSIGSELHPDVVENTHLFQQEFEQSLGKMLHAELNSVGEHDGVEMTVLNAKCLELLDKYGFERGSDVKNYNWLFKQIRPSTILNKII